MLWEYKPRKTYGVLIKQSMLSILGHIIYGERLLKTVEKPNTDDDVDYERISQAPDSPRVNEDHLRQLMDMGFSQEHARRALVNTRNIEQATEYLLTTRPPAALQTESQVCCIIFNPVGVWLEISGVIMH